MLANGMPYLLGNERFKGSHSMSGYHSTELCYLAAVYTNLLITKQPMDFYFKPYPNRSRITYSASRAGYSACRAASTSTKCWIDDEPYTDFDAMRLTVTLPKTDERQRSR